MRFWELQKNFEIHCEPNVRIRYFPVRVFSHSNSRGDLLSCAALTEVGTNRYSINVKHRKKKSTCAAVVESTLASRRTRLVCLLLLACSCVVKSVNFPPIIICFVLSKSLRHYIVYHNASTSQRDIITAKRNHIAQPRYHTGYKRKKIRMLLNARLTRIKNHN